MADLRQDQASWDRFLGRELAGMFLACLYELQELEDRYARQRTRLVVLGDLRGSVGPKGVRLEGVDLGRNTSLAGYLSVHVLGAQDPRTVRLYRAPGGPPADLVAEGQGAAGTELALASRNDSRLTGAFDLALNPTEDTSDRLQLYPVPDWQVRLKRVWDGTHPKDVRSQDEFLVALTAVATRLRDARLIVAEALAAFATRLGGRGAEFLGATHTALVTDTPVRDPSGSIARRRTGFLPALARAMEDESVAGPQRVAERRVKASAAVFAPKNRGQGHVAAHAPREFCPPARWTFRCVRGQDSGHGGQEEFEVTVKLAGEDRQFSFGGVRIKQSFSGPEGIGPFVLEPTFQRSRPGFANYIVAKQLRSDDGAPPPKGASRDARRASGAPRAFPLDSAPEATPWRRLAALRRRI